MSAPIGANKIDILTKTIILLYRETAIKIEMSTELAKDILNVIKIPRVKTADNISLVIEELKHFISNLVATTDAIELNLITETVGELLKNTKDQGKSFLDNITKELTDKELTRNVMALRKLLRQYADSQRIAQLISKTSLDINTNLQDDSLSILNIASLLYAELDKLLLGTDGRSNETDPAVVREMSIGDTTAMIEVMNEVKELSSGEQKFKCGWNGIMEMTSGGFRRGEFVLINALEFKYKSGFSQSLAAQLAIHNNAYQMLKDKSKKGMILYISTEDDPVIFSEFLYKYLYVNEYKAMPDMSNITSQEMAGYMRKRIGANGYELQLLRVIPELWTYKKLQEKILSYEAAGYEVHAVIVDYLAKIPTTGIPALNGTGSDFKEMLQRMRSFAVNNDILFITPHQLDSGAKQLIKNGVSDQTFVKEVAEKGYTEISKTIEQIVDLALYIHVAWVNRKAYLTVQRGKHRTPNIIEPDKKFFMLPFETKGPILEDIKVKMEEMEEVDGIKVEEVLIATNNAELDENDFNIDFMSAT